MNPSDWLLERMLWLISWMQEDRMMTFYEEQFLRSHPSALQIVMNFLVIAGLNAPFYHEKVAWLHALANQENVLVRMPYVISLPRD